MKTKGKTLCLLTAVVLAALATGCANDKSIIREQSDGQLALTLSVSKAKCKEGELITAVVTLKNLTSDPLLVHWINIEPAYLSTADPEALPVGISENWRSAYESMMMLGRYECPGRSLLAFIPPENPRDAIEIYNRLLEGVRCGKGASVGLIPTRTVLTVTKEFKATRDMNLIDVGLFCNREWFVLRVVEDSGNEVKTVKVTPPDPIRASFLKHPRIWTGSLYISIEVKVD